MVPTRHTEAQRPRAADLAGWGTQQRTGEGRAAETDLVTTSHTKVVQP